MTRRASPLALVASLAACSRATPPGRDDVGRPAAPSATTAQTSAAALSPPPLASPPPPRERERDTDEARAHREALVRRIGQGELVKDARVLETLRAIPRHAFVPGATIPQAYADSPQPIGHGQTISQPTIVAMMTSALELTGKERVLEIGTGSGYQAAVLSRLAREVYSIEIVAPLGEDARARLARLGYANVHVRVGDGYQGWPEHAPFDRVILTAAPDELPRALLDQLAPGGVLVAPVGPLHAQDLVRWRKTDGGVVKETLAPVHFVPMVPGR